MAALKRYQHYINGEWVNPCKNEWIISYNPYSGEPWAEIPRGDAIDADRAVSAAAKSFTSGDWPKVGATARGAMLRRLGDLIAINAQKLAAIEVQDNGKLIAEMGAQLSYIPQWYYYFGGLADKIEGSVLPIDKPDTFNFTVHEPLGVCVAITPWNSPLLITAWKLAPALAAGNTIVLKPSEFTSASAFEFVKLVEEAGFPPGVINVVSGYGNEIGEALVAHDRVAKISFTGGTASGTRVYENAARGIKKVSLELGGKSPNIVFDDCEIENAVKGVISGIFAATGQTCIAGSRLLVQESIHDEFVDRLVALAKTAKMGDPMSMETQVGPVTTPSQYEKILGYFDIAKEDGAECVLGGGIPDDPSLGNGWFVQPTIYTKVQNSMRIAQEEIFGPVLSIIPFEDDDHAVEIANDVVYGLASGVWTQSIRRALDISRRIQAGTVWVNTYRAVSFVSPFGGFKHSGLGKESGQQAIREYMQTKSVWINTAQEVPNPFIMR